MKLNVVFIVVALLLSTSLVGAENETQAFGDNTMNMLVPPTAAPTDSPAPTAPTTSPTDSPVPSPSPSEVPTGEPTGTPRPTITPSESPTDSPVPSPSPSITPSGVPSAPPSIAPSSFPSSAPTSAPSSNPSSTPSRTPSAAPSRMPSSSPSLSSQPSSTPTISPMPSSEPSITPSSMPSSEPSIAPSSDPTAHSMIISTFVSVTMQNLMTGLSGDTLKVFEEQAAEFIRSELPDAKTMGVRVDITSVVVVEQKIVLDGKNVGNSTRRFLKESGLRVRMEVMGEIFPGDPPDDFAFASLVSMPFAKNYLVFLYRLGSADPFFNQLLGGAPNPFIQDTEKSSGTKSRGATAGIVIACMAAVAIAAAAAMYAIRLRDKNSGFKKPANITTDSGENFRLEQSDSHSSCMTPYDQAHPDFKSPTSPNTLENGKSTRLGISRKESEADALSQTDTVQSERFVGLGIRVPTRLDTDQGEKGAYCSTIPFCGLFGAQDKEEEGISLNVVGGRNKGSVDPNVPKEVDTSNLIVPKTMIKSMSEPVVPRKKDQSTMRKSEPAFKSTGKKNREKPHKGFPSTTKSAPIPVWRNDEESLDEKLTKDATVVFNTEENDPWRTSLGISPNHEYASHDDDESVLFENPTTEVAAAKAGGFACGTIPGFLDMNKMAGGLLGARRMDQDEQVQYKERKSDEALPQKRTGLYDVYAPPGALGIVVDTTKDGPVIHSMKASSSLLGLAGPGDLIVGLDDLDTRSMTAASLTRLLAKRAHLPERKLTLLATDK